jgi:hypothetical protein
MGSRVSVYPAFEKLFLERAKNYQTYADDLRHDGNDNILHSLLNMHSGIAILAEASK